MTRGQARGAAREILKIVPRVMRAVAAELRAAGELTAPAHFGLLSILTARPRALSELAALQGVSLPTMSNSIAALVDQGWVRRRTAPTRDRRVLTVEVTPRGRAALGRVRRSAESHLAVTLVPLDAPARRRLLAGLEVLRTIFDGESRPRARSRAGRRAEHARRFGPTPHGAA